MREVRERGTHVGRETESEEDNMDTNDCSCVSPGRGWKNSMTRRDREMFLGRFSSVCK